MLWALVPAKLSSEAKERLDPLLSRELRVELARAMLVDVLSALAAADAFAGIAVVSRDPETLGLAVSCDAVPVVERGPQGLNRAVEEGIASCVAAGASGIVIVMGDIPLVTPEEIRQVIQRLPERGVVLVPSADGTGTNILAARPPGALPTQFGPGSLGRHRVAAEELDITTVIYDAPGAALDIDTADDFERLLAAGSVAPATRRVLLAVTAQEREPGSV